MSSLFLISACLCGIPCRYNATGAFEERFLPFLASGQALPVCPELLGGLPTPRPPCEIVKSRVFSREGQEYTDAFAQGAALTLALAHAHGIRMAVLKERSPSCGPTRLYDGAFSGCTVPGKGITAALLYKNGILIHNETVLPKVLQGYFIRGEHGHSLVPPHSPLVRQRDNR